MNTDLFQTIVYSSMSGMAIYALLQCVTQPRHRQTLYLAILLGLLLSHVFGKLLIVSGAYVYAPWLVGAELPLKMLLGPALYFYAHATMSRQKTLPRGAYIKALVGPVVAILGILPFMLGVSSEQKLALADPATRDPELFQFALLTCLFSAVVFIGFTAVYLGAAVRLHAHHRRQLMDRFSDIDKRSMDWFRVVLILWGCAWSLYAIESALGFVHWRWFGKGIVLPAVEAVILVAFVHMAIRQPVLKDNEKGEQKQAPRPSVLSADRMQAIADKLHHAMTDDALFKDETLSLNRLSHALAVSENHISETLSQHLQTNFFHFVNGFRVEEAKRQLAESNTQVTAIAFDVGFNTKSTFNTAFKKLTGTTPSAYRREKKAA